MRHLQFAPFPFCRGSELEEGTLAPPHKKVPIGKKSSFIKMKCALCEVTLVLICVFSSLKSDYLFSLFFFATEGARIQYKQGHNWVYFIQRSFNNYKEQLGSYLYSDLWETKYDVGNNLFAPKMASFYRCPFLALPPQK